LVRKLKKWHHKVVFEETGQEAEQLEEELCISIMNRMRGENTPKVVPRHKSLQRETQQKIRETKMQANNKTKCLLFVLRTLCYYNYD
jgi:hypothetical protein